MTAKLRWGILSTAKIAQNQVIPALTASASNEVTAIASRDTERARAVADTLAIKRAYGSYEQLLTDPDVDVIYNPLPNHMHVPWTIRAIDAGKHVLCEKPIGLDAADARRLQAATQQTNRLVMEAFMYRFHPQWQKAKQHLDDGRIGNLLAIHSIFSHYNDDPGNIRNQADIGGGALMDLGCYSISLSRFLLGRSPHRVSAQQQIHPDFQVDVLTSACLDYGSVQSLFTCTSMGGRYQRVLILGSNGRIEIEIPFNAPTDQPCRLWLQQEHRITEIVCAVANQYTLQVEAFAEAICTGNALPYNLEDAVANMDIIDTLVESAKRNEWVTLS
ncbi:Gfo/Idh/MocA family protein [Planctomycetota bacterium]